MELKSQFFEQSGPDPSLARSGGGAYLTTGKKRNQSTYETTMNTSFNKQRKLKTINRLAIIENNSQELVSNSNQKNIVNIVQISKNVKTF